jgi:peptidyl-prolyl cis-trans isomerase C
MFKKLLREPLLHFLLIGAALFAVYAVVNPDAMQSDKRIVVDQGQINTLAQRFKRVWQRDPNEQELQGLIEDFVIEEIYYREALAMGIDKDDPVIRRRLRQKMELYTDNLASTLAPTDAVLNEYLQRHADKFEADSRYTFKQIFVNADAATEQLNEQLAAIESDLQDGKTVTGDQSLLPVGFEDADAFTVDRTFGKGFALQLDAVPLNQWSQPLRSGLGVHFVFVSNRQPGYLPALADIRNKVEREWRFDQAQSIDRTLREKLLAGYQIEILNPATGN